MTGTERTGLLRESGAKGDPAGANSAEGGPSGESECPTFQSTVKF
ncbi:hypothetical protein [Peribacillus frigoritolerans]|uniref:Uncharacterized protein n=1 Tax=Peribacillus castrilensis TaxID=2897690 RepID=A0AAW9NH40_9BACI|nr:hypothetical protein [Peribacillus castrilensis]